MATHSRILAWRIPPTGEPGGQQTMGSWRVGHDWATNTFTFTGSWKDMHLRFWTRYKICIVKAYHVREKNWETFHGHRVWERLGGGLNPAVWHYRMWHGTHRAPHEGWRLSFFLVTESFLPASWGIPFSLNSRSLSTCPLQGWCPQDWPSTRRLQRPPQPCRPNPGLCTCCFFSLKCSFCGSSHGCPSWPVQAQPQGHPAGTSLFWPHKFQDSACVPLSTCHLLKLSWLFYDLPLPWEWKLPRQGSRLS